MELEDALKEAASPEGHVTCARALALARRLGVEAGRVGEAANRLGLRVVDCQLGCFGTARATHEELAGFTPRPDVVRAIEAHLSEGRLPCAAAFGVAARLKVRPRLVGDTATVRHVKISRCQLGCFP